MIALNTLTRIEKLQVMEALWEDLSRESAAIPVPDWHLAALAASEAAAAAGEAEFLSLDEAKQRLRRNT